jgi:hypothetical protein
LQKARFDKNKQTSELEEEFKARKEEMKSQHTKRVTDLEA